MIHIDRSQVETPGILLSERAEQALHKAQEFYQRGRIQERFEFDAAVLHHKEVMDALQRLFHQKCAYCETPIGSIQPVDVEHFRPKLRAVNLDGTIDPYHYFWLAYEWANLFPVCSECNRSKGSRFPITGSRATVGTVIDELVREGALLLNPCEDAPEKHLVFSTDGMVTSPTEQGRVSIDVYGLNRAGLIAARKDEYARLVAELEDVPGADVEWSKKLADLNDLARPYAGMRRQFIGEWVKKQLGKSAEPIFTSTFDEVAQDVVQQPVFSMHQQQVIKSNYKRYSQEQSDYSLSKGENIDRYYARTRWIEKIKIHNYKIIKDLTLYPTSGKRSQGPWLMLLGENGTGKSSLLQAVVLTLVGDQYRELLHISPQDVLRNRCSSGYVKVYLAGNNRPIELHFSDNNSDFQSNLPDARMLLLGYGATRLLPRDGADPMPGTAFAHVDNLFNPFIPLKDASQWLYALHEQNKTKFGNVARALKSLLMLGEADELVCDPNIPGQVNVRAFGQTVSIKQQSDGYQTVLALACDIMAILLERWDAMEVAEGIVMIDEIGSHLHPRWQMRVVKCLREVFPRVQFLVTTHYPLCLRGLYNGELVVLQRTSDHKLIAIDRDLPSVEGMRVDQLLTSEYFGLNSTLDPELDQDFHEYYHLLALRQLSQEEEQLLQQLKARLDTFRLLGTTRRERLALEAVDQYLAKEPQLKNLDERKEFKEETRQKVSDMWANIGRGKK